MQNDATAHPQPGSLAAIQQSFRWYVRDNVPVNVYCGGLVLSGHAYAGWRRKVLSFALWLIRKTGHVVIM